MLLFFVDLFWFFDQPSPRDETFFDTDTIFDLIVGNYLSILDGVHRSLGMLDGDRKVDYAFLIKRHLKLLFFDLFRWNFNQFLEWCLC